MYRISAIIRTCKISDTQDKASFLTLAAVIKSSRWPNQLQPIPYQLVHHHARLMVPGHIRKAAQIVGRLSRDQDGDPALVLVFH